MRGVRASSVSISLALAWLLPFEAAAQLANGAAAPGIAPLSIAEPAAGQPGLALASWAMRGSFAASLLIGALAIAWWLLRHRAALSKSATPPAPGEIDAEWLQRHVFSLSPELVGAAYDRRIAWPEVAAVVARMSVESKLASRVASGEQGWSNLELWLLVERDELAGYERELIESIFFSGKTTSGDAIRQAYRGVGFDPASILRRHLKESCDALLGTRRLFTWPLRLVLVLGALGLLLCSSSGLGGVLLIPVAGAVGVLASLLSVRIAARRRDDPEQPLVEAQIAASGIAASAVVLALLLAFWPGLSALAGAGLVAWGLASATLGARLVVAKESASGLEVRRNLAAARRFFAAELARPEPRIQDEWLPYLIALELKGEVDHWFLAFGRLETAARRERLAQRASLASLSGVEPAGATASAEPAASAAGPLSAGDEPASPSASVEPSGIGPTASSSESAWTGGAGAYGGTGASGAWIAATTGLTVAVPGRRAPFARELGYV